MTRHKEKEVDGNIIEAVPENVWYFLPDNGL